MPRFFVTFVALGFASGCTRPEAAYVRSGTPEVNLELRRASSEPVDGWTTMNVDGETSDAETLYVSPKVEISNDDLVSTGVQQEEGGGCRILFKLNANAAKRFGKLSEELVGINGVSRERLALLVDGKLWVAPIVTAPMHDGVIPVGGPWSRTQAEQMARSFVRSRSDSEKLE